MRSTSAPFGGVRCAQCTTTPAPTRRTDRAQQLRLITASIFRVRGTGAPGARLLDQCAHPPRQARTRRRHAAAAANDSPPWPMAVPTDRPQYETTTAALGVRNLRKCIFSVQHSARRYTLSTLRASDALHERLTYKLFGSAIGPSPLPPPILRSPPNRSVRTVANEGTWNFQAQH
uniref:Uncharacterized protein n=1 Tax=Plectus sambesii TaxID=2011161 RepID=A0A914UVU1_9BILA